MELKDYLHYYINSGISVYVFPDDTITNGFLAKYRQDYPDGVYNPVLTLDNYTKFLNDGYKPLLRRLEDVTDDEWLDIEHETSIAPDAIGWHGIREAFMTTDTRHRWHWTVTNEVLIILRKRGVDVDNLIDAGLAVDIKTINP